MTLKTTILCLLATALFAGSAVADSKFSFSVKATNAAGENVTTRCYMMGMYLGDDGKWAMDKCLFPDAPIPIRGTTPRAYKSMVLFIKTKETAKITASLVQETGGKPMPVMNITVDAKATYVTNDERLVKKVMEVNPSMREHTRQP